MRSCIYRSVSDRPLPTPPRWLVHAADIQKGAAGDLVGMPGRLAHIDNPSSFQHALEQSMLRMAGFMRHRR